MAENKKQHYVPQFYLKYFSISKANTHLKIFNKSKKFIIPKGGLKNQACDNYFYGKDNGVEDGFGDLEDKAAIIFKKITQDSCLPSLSSDNYFHLWLFTLLQAYRTKFMANSLNDNINNIFHQIAEYDSKLKKLMEGVKVEHTQPALFNLQIITDVLHEAFDLEAKLIVNESKQQFLTSDNPVMRYNQFLEKKNHPSGRLGLAIKGLQIFYPLTPKLLLVLYDRKVYKVGNKKQKVISTVNKNDIDELNLLQFINSDKVLFSNETISDEYLKTLATKGEKHTKLSRIINKKTHKKNKSGENTVIIHQYGNDLGTKLKLSFIKETTYAKKYKMTGYAAELRTDNRP